MANTKKLLPIVTLLTLVLILMALPGSVLAEGGQDPKFSAPRPLGSSLFEPFQQYLSGSVWLVTQGLDPRFRSGPMAELFPPQDAQVRGIAPQAGGGQGPLVPYRDPSTKFSRNILVTRDFSPVPFQTEPSLAVDPKDPEHILLGVIDYNFPGMTTYSSIDGGATWEGPHHVKYPPDDEAAAGDPVLAFDREGTAYIAGISLVSEDFRVGNAYGTTATSGIPVSRSFDGGITWEEPITSRRAHVASRQLTGANEGERTSYELSLPFLDKPWLAIGPSKDDASKDILYITYTKFVTSFPIFFLFDVDPFIGVPITRTSIEMVRSEDAGRTWSEPVTIGPIVETSIGEDIPKRVLQGSQPAVASDGTLYVAYLDSTDDDSFKKRAEIYVGRSEDNGQTFTIERAADFNELPFNPRNAFFRYWGSSFPQITIDPKGDIYVAYTARSPSKEDDGDIYIAMSKDRGENWTNKKLNNDITNRIQFFPSISAGPDGTVHVMWGDMRDDPVETRYHIYYTSSEDGGETWGENSRVTDFPSNPNHAFPGGRFIGDYFTIKASETDVYLAWPDARLGEFGPLNQKIGFARKKLMPLPSIFLSPPAGPAGQDITIQGSNFQPRQDVFLEISGAIVSTVRSDDVGSFTARLFVPISGEGAHNVRAIDASGNIAPSTFFMDFGFDNIETSVKDIVDRLGSVQQSVLEGRDLGLPPELPSQIQSIQESLSALDQLPTIQNSLSQLPAIQASVDILGSQKDDGDMEAWVVVLLAAASALVAAIAGVAIGARATRPSR